MIAARIPGRLQHCFVSTRAAYIAPCLSRRVNSRAKSDPRAGGVSQDLQHLHPPCRPAPPFPWPPEPVPIEHHEAAPSSLVLSGHRRSFTALASPRSSAWEEPCNGPSPFAQRRTQADEKNVAQVSAGARGLQILEASRIPASPRGHDARAGCLDQGIFELSWRPLGVMSELSWGNFGSFGGLFGLSWGLPGAPLGLSLGALEAVLGPSWRPSISRAIPTWSPSNRLLGPSRSALGALSGPSRGHRGPRDGPKRQPTLKTFGFEVILDS